MLFLLDPAFVWPSLGRRLSLYLACNPFPVFVRVPELAGDARQWGQLGLCLCSLIEQLDQQFRFLLRYPRQ